VKTLGVVLALLAAVACGPVPAGPGVKSGTVSGRVVATPCRPVERPGDPPCPPVPGVTVEFGGTTTVTDSGGAYSISLPPGTYPIKVKAGAWERPATPASVTVPAGAALVVNLTYDSGIR
jgi:carboxypeptidase family protein